MADVVPGFAVTEEITGGVVSTTIGGFTTTVAEPYFKLLATLVARTVITACEVTLVGALYSPVVEILPKAGLMDQTTALFVVPETVAANCAVAAAAIVVVDGLTTTEIAVGFEMAMVAVLVTPAPVAVT